MAVFDEIRARRGEVQRLADGYGICDVRVFGSVARGDEDEDSDIDFLVRLAPTARGLAIGGFLMDLSQLFGRRVDVATEAMLNPRWRDRALKEAVPL